jgi:hypothetical protein
MGERRSSVPPSLGTYLRDRTMPPALRGLAAIPNRRTRLRIWRWRGRIPRGPSPMPARGWESWRRLLSVGRRCPSGGRLHAVDGRVRTCSGRRRCQSGGPEAPEGGVKRPARPQSQRCLGGYPTGQQRERDAPLDGAWHPLDDERGTIRPSCTRGRCRVDRVPSSSGRQRYLLARAAGLRCRFCSPCHPDSLSDAP